MEKTEAGTVCKIAYQIFDAWKEGVLTEFLTDIMHIELQEAKQITLNYRGVKPVEICPVDIINGGQWNQVFPLLGLQIDNVWPKNILGWHVIKHVYGEECFNWKLVGKGTSGRDNHIDWPNRILDANGEFVPFGIAALEYVEIGKLPAHIQKKAKFMIDELGDIGLDLAITLFKADILLPPKKIVKQLLATIKRGLAGECVMLTGCFCPDYAYRTKVEQVNQYEYTFDSLNGGVGLVAQQFVRVLPCIIDFFVQHGITYSVKLAIADFEANSEEVLKSVNMDYEAFIIKCEESLVAFAQEFAEIEMELVLFERDWSQGRLSRYTNEIRHKMVQRDFGDIERNTGKRPMREVEFIAKNGASFYRRWYERPEMTQQEIETLVIAQGAEYAALGRILQEDFGNMPVIQIAGDRPKMQMFNTFMTNIPTLCCKRVY
jgi:hypothetical protein